MTSDLETAVERPRAVLEEARVLVRLRGLEVRFTLVGLEVASFEEGNHLVEHGEVVRDLDVVVDHVGQPHTVIGDAGAHPASGRRMPPVLHVPLAKLARGGAQEMRARQLTLRHGDRQDVLELVAKAVGGSRLVEGRA